MLRARLRTLYSGLIAAFLCLGTFSPLPSNAEIIPVPALTRHVNDLTGALSPATASELDGRLAAYEADKGSQIVVLIVPTTGEEDIQAFSYRVVLDWKLGRKGVDDGVLFLVAKNDRRSRIEVGRGLEGALTDVNANRILRDFVAPEFKENNFDGGITAGVDKILSVIGGEDLPAPVHGATSGGSRADVSNMAFIVGIVAIGIGTALASVIGTPAAAGLTGLATTGVMAFLGSLGFGIIVGLVVAFFVAGQLGGRGGGMYSSSGGGWGSSSGGGGFSGGGGSFSGGGASGSW